jgi:hypothetical protein
MGPKHSTPEMAQLNNRLRVTARPSPVAETNTRNGKFGSKPDASTETGQPPDTHPCGVSPCGRARPHRGTEPPTAGPRARLGHAPPHLRADDKKPAAFQTNQPTNADAATSPPKEKRAAARAMAATSSASVAAALASHPFTASASASSSRVSASGHRAPRPFRVATIRCSSASPNLSQGAPAPAPPKPQIELEFVGVSLSLISTHHIIWKCNSLVCAGWVVESGAAVDVRVRLGVRLAEAGCGRLLPGGPGGGGERREAPPRRHEREQDRALRRIRGSPLLSSVFSSDFCHRSIV